VPGVVSSADPAGDEVSYVADDEAADEVRLLASHGRLADHARKATPAEYNQIHRGAYVICWPVVFQCLTRGIEHGRGHHRCATGVEHLQPECLDRFEDDVEAVVADLLRNAKEPIRNVEGWVRSRIKRATIDGHRRRRGERGAVQRPRLPKWLAEQLGEDPWLLALAIHVQTWVGVPATAGTALWPCGAWAEQRIAITGEAGCSEHDVMKDVETVLAAMRWNRGWYERFIERPLGRKQAPLLATDTTADRAYTPLTEPNGTENALLSEFAAVAIDAMAARMARGEDSRTVVVDIIRAVFGSGTGAEQMDRLPGAGSAEDESARVTLGDPESVDRIVREVLDILGIPDA
jgi:hypothetical protein